jgi:hypothetical protein
MSINQHSFNKDIITACPHCFSIVIIKKSDINCKIFRHGVMKSTNQQINPHSTEQECQYFINNDLIYGCGKPFMLVLDGETWYAEICDYV